MGVTSDLIFFQFVETQPLQTMTYLPILIINHSLVAKKTALQGISA
jgi:hypothetical protein